MFNLRQIIYTASNLTKTQGSPWKMEQNGYESQSQWMTTAKWCFRNTRFFLSLFVASIIIFSLFFPNWPRKHCMYQAYFNTDTDLVLVLSVLGFTAICWYVLWTCYFNDCFYYFHVPNPFILFCWLNFEQCPL